MAVLRGIKKSFIHTTNIPKRYIFKMVFRAIRNKRFIFAAFLRINKSVIALFVAIFILIQVINMPIHTEEGIVLIKIVMVIVAIAAVISDWRFSYKEIIKSVSHPKLASSFRRSYRGIID